MRPIKFRAWDEKKKKLWLPYVNTTMTHGECIDDFTDDVLMQFTGLKDKNGKEIYEGDIVRDEDGSEAYEIVFEDAEFFCKKQKGERSLKTRTHEIEVIGNIYENPELLMTQEKND